MSSIEKRMAECFKDGQVWIRPLMEQFSIRFEGLSLDDLNFIIRECRDIKYEIMESEKVEGYKTVDLTNIGFCDTVYFGADELDIVKQSAKEAIDKGNLRFRIEKVRLPKEVLEGHIRDRKAWENT